MLNVAWSTKSIFRNGSKYLKERKTGEKNFRILPELKVLTNSFKSSSEATKLFHESSI